MSNTYSSFRKQIAKLYGTKSNKKAVWAITKNWIALIIVFTAIGFATANLPLAAACVAYVPLSFLAGCCLRGFDNLTHEASHNNIFKSPKAHPLFQFLFAYPVLKTIEDYRPGHFQHHKNYTDHKDDDPDTQQNIRWGVEHLPAKKSWKQIGWFYIVRFFLGYYFFDNLKYSVVPHFKSKKSVAGRLLFWHVLLGVIMVTNTWALFLLAYAIPYLVWLPYIRFVTESSKHTNVNLENDFSNSRNNIGLIHQIFLHPHNDGFHQMHHYIASIPFYNLKKAYIYMKSDPSVKAQLIESHSPYETILQEFKMK